ncbi:MAG: GNAT family N-acetyltransferase [Caldilineaceae bacterium]
MRLYTRLGFAPIRELTNRVGGRSVEMLYTFTTGETFTTDETFTTENKHMADDTVLIRSIEEASLNAWPAHQTMVDWGWLIRFAEGYTRRSNSVNPIYAAGAESDDDVIARIARCEALYRARNQPTIFKLTPLMQPAHLDELLAARGYVYEAPTTVRRRSLADPLPVNDVDGSVQIEEKASERWIRDFSHFSNYAAWQVEALRGILSNIVTTTGYATLLVNGEAVSCGLAVVEGKLVGLYDIVTAASARGRGYGVHMLATLLDWAKAHSAQTAYLAVMDDNLSAKRLYDKLGFTELYPYWYRVKR